MKLFLLCIHFALVLAVPYSSHCTSTPPAVATWRRFSNYIISLLWSAPKSPVTEVGWPNVYSRYGRDIVVRFNISSAEEAAALVEAAEVLFLDVWDFHEEWVDIRLETEKVLASIYLFSVKVHADPAL